MTNRTALVWSDVGGNTRLSTFNNDGANTAILAALQAVSNGGISAWWDGAVVNPAPTLVAATYRDVRDSALLTYQDATGDFVKIYVPCPQSGIFLADLVTVNPAAVASVTTAMVAHGRSASGQAIVSLVAGVYQRNARLLQGG